MESINRPILKWAGGKTQLLDELMAKAPTTFEKYIEPFLGGGAMFFALVPRTGVIADSNPELVNLYRCVAENVEGVIGHLRGFENTESKFYETRSLSFSDLEAEYAAARTIYLNRTCFNGLYRVNKKGQFNAPFGRYKNPRICRPETLRSASNALRNVEIVWCKWGRVVTEHGTPGVFPWL